MGTEVVVCQLKKQVYCTGILNPYSVGIDFNPYNAELFL